MEPDRIEAIAREQLNLRGIDDQAGIEKRLREIDRKIVKQREAMNRLIRFHAESETLNDQDFDRAVTSMQLAIEKLQQDREYLLRQLPGAKTAEDQSVISQVASEVLQRLQSLSFDDKQRVIALLDVRVRVDEDGRVLASLSAPDSQSLPSQRKVAKRTSSRSGLNISPG